MPDDDEFERKKQKYLTKMFAPYIEYARKVLFEKVADVLISSRLTTQPCVVVADVYGQSSFMDKIQKAQMFGNQHDAVPANRFKKILEINPNHKINQIILQRVKVHLCLNIERRKER